MNKALIRLLANPLTDETKAQALKILSQSNVERSEVFDFLENQYFVINVSEIAAGYVSSGAAAISRQATWEALLGSDEISSALAELLQNGSVINYTQAVMMVTISMMMEDK